MGKIIEGLFDKKGPNKKEIRSFLKKKGKSRTVCYVLITCSEAKKNGKMEVELKYEGDKMLASYLIDSAAKIMEKE